jgi:23S rRNA pseudouridine2605 synthase
MPPRYVYWTILAGGLPTAFRAAEREELLPTFQRLRDKHPDAELKYFAQGKLWASPEEARAAREAGNREARGRDWRPGGEHRDPRQKFKDEKKADNQRRRQERFDRKEASGKTRRPEWTDDPNRGSASETRRPAAGRPERKDRPPFKPEWKSRPPRDGNSRPDTRNSAEGASRRGGERPPFDRPRTDGPREDRPREDRKDWRDKAPGNKPHDKPWAASGGRPAWKDRPGFKPDWKGRAPQGAGGPSDKPGRGFQRPDSNRRDTRFDKTERREVPSGEGRPDWRSRPPGKPTTAHAARDDRPDWRKSSRPREDRPGRAPSGGGGATGGEGRGWKDRPPQQRDSNRSGGSPSWKHDQKARPDREPRGDGSAGAPPPRPNGPRGPGASRPFQGRNRRS